MIPAIETTGLTKRFRSRVALHECSLAIPRGAVTALVGRNGAGKTTLMHLAVGLVRPTAGRIAVEGWDPVRDSSEVLRRVGFVAHDHPMYRRFTVEEMLRLGRHLNQAWDDAVAKARLHAYDVPLSQRCGTLSGGQRAQLALALALGKQPEILLLDEPSATLDPLARHEFLASLMEAVATDGLTVLFSTHDIRDLDLTCDHLVLLADGRLQLSASIQDVLDSHRILLGPVEALAALQARAGVIWSTTAGRTARAVARIGENPVPPEWEVRQPSLEDIVLAYLRNPGAAALPGARLLAEASR
jgi:ABC-2 type transport system ATP-binding protein